MKNKHLAGALTFLFLITLSFSELIHALGTQDLAVGSYTLESSRRVTRTDWQYTYRATVANAGNSVFSGVTAALVSNSPNTKVIDGSVGFGNVAQGGSAPATDTFTIQQNRSFVFNPADLTWTLSAAAERVVVPNVIGQTQAAATTGLTGVGLTLGAVTQQSSNIVPAGSVISQDPAADSLALVGSAFTLVVSSGPPVASPASLDFSASQLVIGAGSPLTIVAEVKDSNGNTISPNPPISFEVLADPGTTVGTLPVVAGNEVQTAADTRGTFALKGTVTGTAISAQLTFTVIKNESQSANSGLYVELASVQASVVDNLGAIADAFQSGDTGSIQGARQALLAAAGTVDLEKLSLSTPYDPDTGFVPTAAQLASRGFPQQPSDAAFANLTAQIRNKINAVTQLLNQPSGDDAADTAALEQYANELDLLFQQLQQAANTPSPYGLSNSASAVSQLLASEIPRTMLALIQRVDTELQLSGLASIQGGPQALYTSADPGLQSLLLPRSQQSPQGMYSSAQPVFLLTGLLGYGGIYGKLVQKIYGEFLDQLQKMMILLAAQDLLNDFLAQTAGVAALKTGASLSFHVYHAADSLIEVTGVSRAQATNADVFLIGGAAVNAVSDLINQLLSAGGITSISELYDFYEGMLDAIRGLGQTYEDAHQQPDYVDGPYTWPDGCWLSFGSCVELYYNSGFDYVGSGGPVNIEPVIILIRVNNPLGSSFGSGIYNFVGS